MSTPPPGPIDTPAGAIMPFGAERSWPVIADASLATLRRVAIGGGARGVNLHLAAADLVAHLGAELADVSDPGPMGPEAEGQATRSTGRS